MSEITSRTAPLYLGAVHHADVERIVAPLLDTISAVQRVHAELERRVRDTVLGVRHIEQIEADRAEIGEWFAALHLMRQRLAPRPRRRAAPRRTGART